MSYPYTDADFDRAQLEAEARADARADLTPEDERPWRRVLTTWDVPVSVEDFGPTGVSPLPF